MVNQHLLTDIGQANHWRQRIVAGDLVSCSQRILIDESAATTGHRAVIKFQQRNILNNENQWHDLNAGSGDKSPGQFAFLFPGIGYHEIKAINMLFAVQPFKTFIEAAFDYLREQHDIGLKSLLTDGSAAVSSRNFAHKLKRVKQGAAAENAHKTLFAHPLLFVFQLGFAHLLESIGIKASYLLGYSLGEYSAATLAGAFSQQQALDLIAFRAKQINTLPGAGLLAVAAPAADVEPLLTEGVEIAAINSPLQTIVAGSEPGLQQFRLVLDSHNQVAQAVTVQHGFHSSYMRPIVEPLSGYLQEQPVSRLQQCWISTIDCCEYPPGSVIPNHYWPEQLLRPVNFQDSIQRLLKHDCMLIEISSGNALSLLVKQNPQCPRSQWSRLLAPLASVSADGDVLGALLEFVISLWLRGEPIVFSGFGESISTKVAALADKERI